MSNFACIDLKLFKHELIKHFKAILTIGPCNVITVYHQTIYECVIAAVRPIQRYYQEAIGSCGV